MQAELLQLKAEQPGLWLGSERRVALRQGQGRYSVGGSFRAVFGTEGLSLWLGKRGRGW